MRAKSAPRTDTRSQTYRLVHPDGTIETWVAEVDTLRNPTEYQFIRQGGFIRVVDGSLQYYNKATLQPVKHTVRYTLSQSFHGGAGAKGDMAKSSTVSLSSWGLGLGNSTPCSANGTIPRGTPTADSANSRQN